MQIDISGRIDGTAEIRELMELLLKHGGAATDDYSAHLWTLQEIKSGAINDGARFVDFRSYHQLSRQQELPDSTTRSSAPPSLAMRVPSHVLRPSTAD